MFRIGRGLLTTMLSATLHLTRLRGSFDDRGAELAARWLEAALRRSPVLVAGVGLSRYAHGRATGEPVAPIAVPS